MGLRDESSWWGRPVRIKLICLSILVQELRRLGRANASWFGSEPLTSTSGLVRIPTISVTYAVIKPPCSALDACAVAISSMVNWLPSSNTWCLSFVATLDLAHTVLLLSSQPSILSQSKFAESTRLSPGMWQKGCCSVVKRRWSFQI